MSLQLVREAAHPEADVISGSAIDDSLGDEIWVTITAVGLDEMEAEASSSLAWQASTVKAPAAQAAPDPSPAPAAVAPAPRPVPEAAAPRPLGEVSTVRSQHRAIVDTPTRIGAIPLAKRSQRPVERHGNQSLEVPRISSEEADSASDLDILDFLRQSVTFPALSTSVRLAEVGRGTAPLRSNIARHAHDDPILVTQRRRALVDELGRQILWMNRIHSARVGIFAKHGGRTCFDTDSKPSFFDPQGPGTLIEADGVIADECDQPDAPATAVMTADCMPVFLSSAGGHIVAAVHAGRGRSLNSTLTRAFRLMRALDPSTPTQALTAPSICGRCYEASIDMQIECVWSRPELEPMSSWGTPAPDLFGAARAELLSMDCQRVAIDPRYISKDDTPHSYR